ncbi:MAG: hypothetical protein LBO71_09145 [Prevotellaceae bacterium]|jgi:hypothetical protein|nr:hypothetical protein [Prevotellaceae bacterium]
MIMKMRKVFAMMLMAAAASTAMVACNNDDDKKTDDTIVGEYGGKVFMGGTPIGGEVDWAVTAIKNDTILIATDTIKLGGIGLPIKVKAYGKQDVADSTLYSIDSLKIPTAGIALGGKVSYRSATKTSTISLGGTAPIAIPPAEEPTISPIAITLTGTKK